MNEHDGDLGNVDIYYEKGLILTCSVDGNVKIWNQKKKIVRAVMDQIANQDAEIRKNNARDFWEELLEAAAIYGRIISPNTASRLDYYLMQQQHKINLNQMTKLQMSNSYFLLKIWLSN